MRMDPAEFDQELTAAFGNEAGAVQSLGERGAHALTRLRAHRYCQPRIALLGNAAHTVHPLSGLGANLGLEDVVALHEALLHSLRRKRDIGGMRALRRYERARRGYNRAAMMTLDALKILFGTQTPPVQWLRNTGMDLFDSLPPVKRMIIRQAGGQFVDQVGDQVGS